MPSGRAAPTFCIAQKVGKKSRQNNASPRLPSHAIYFAWPAHWCLPLGG